MSPNDADVMANSVDPDRALIWVCTVCPGISVRKRRIITVFASVNIGLARHNVQSSTLSFLLASNLHVFSLLFMK